MGLWLMIKFVLKIKSRMVRPAGFEPATYGFVALIFGTVGTSRETQGFNYFK
jgi:hypothetical protein